MLAVSSIMCNFVDILLITLVIELTKYYAENRKNRCSG